MKLKGVHRTVSKGHVYFYAWRGGPRLCGDPSTDEAAAAEFFRHRDGRPKKAARIKPKGAATVAEIAQRYKESADWYKGRSPKWRRAKSDFLQDIIAEFGEDDIAMFDDRRAKLAIIEWRDGMRETPRKADHAVGELSLFLKWARRNGYLLHNLAEDIPQIGVTNRADVIWSEEDLAALAKFASPELMAAARLSAVTGLARADLIALRWSDVKDRHIGPIERKKTLQIAIIPRFRAVDVALESCPRRAPQVLTRPNGQPWTADALHLDFHRVKTKAGINKRFHDLRGTAVTMLYGCGLPDDDVARIVGWSAASCRSIKLRYVTPAAIAEGIIAKIDRDDSGTRIVKLSESVKP